TGDIVRVAEVVRDLSRRDNEKGLSAGEKRMLAKARQILISELALARETDEEEATAQLDKVLAESDPTLQAEAEEAAEKVKEAKKAK
ncbi:CarD family transcriptional regulator, partial [Actinotignum timonense]|nr:CarD family transcriptional regulator [Actinotignum timonense]